MNINTRYCSVNEVCSMHGVGSQDLVLGCQTNSRYRAYCTLYFTHFLFCLLENRLVFIRYSMAWVVQKVDNAIHRINCYSSRQRGFFLLTLIQLIAIYPVDSVVHPLNNWHGARSIFFTGLSRESDIFPGIVLTVLGAEKQISIQEFIGPVALYPLTP